MHRSHFSWATAILFAAAASGVARADDAEIVERFEVAKHGERIFLPVTVGDKEYQFMVDTGCTHTVFDRKLLPEVALRTTNMRTPDQDISVPLFDVPPTRLRGIDVRAAIDSAQNGRNYPKTDPLVPGIDFTPFREISGEEIFGCIGMDFLHQWVVQFDFHEGHLTLSKRPQPNDSSKSIQLEYDALGAPIIGCRLPGWGEADFTIDTGGTSGFGQDLAKRLLERKLIQFSGAVQSLSFAGDRTNNKYLVDHFAVRDYLSNDLVFSEGNNNTLGLDYLSRFIVEFDFPHNKLYLREGKDFDKAWEYDHSGLHMRKKAGVALIDRIDPDSAASEADLVAGDRVIRIDNVEASLASLNNLRRCLMKPNAAVHIVVERDGETIDTVLQTRQ